MSVDYTNRVKQRFGPASLAVKPGDVVVVGSIPSWSTAIAMVGISLRFCSAKTVLAKQDLLQCFKLLMWIQVLFVGVMSTVFKKC